MDRISCFLLLLFSLVAVRLDGQDALFRRFGVEDGLPANTVFCVTQDEQGFVWFGTKSGMSRFDSRAFRTFRRQSGDSLSLGNNFVRVIERLDSATFLVGTEDGLYRFDLRAETFIRVHPRITGVVTDVLVDSSGYWVASAQAGLFRWTAADEALRHLDIGANKEGVSRIRSLAYDARGRLWVGTYGFGVFVYQATTDTFLNYRSQDTATGLSNDFVLTLYRDLDGTMWVGTLTGGLNYWSESEGHFRGYRHRPSDPSTLSDDIVRAISQRRPGELLVGTEKGLNVLDIASGEFRSYQRDADPNSLSDNAVWSIFVDRDRNIWVGTYFGGVNYLNVSDYVFEHYYENPSANHTLNGRAVSTFFEDRKGNVWVGTEDGGLSYFDTRQRDFTGLPAGLDNRQLSYHNIHAIVEDDHQLWIGTFAGGLDRYDLRTGAVRHYKHRPNDPASISNNSIYTILRDGGGQLWFGTISGLNRYDADRDAFVRISDFGLGRRTVYDLLEDRDGNVWAATNGSGLFSLDRKSGYWRQHPLQGHFGLPGSIKAISLHEDKSGRIWIGTEGWGLYTLDRTSGELSRAALPLEVETVYGIVEDGAGNLWLSTDNGIVYLNPESGDLQHYTKWDYLQSKQFNFGASLRATDGRIYFGGVNGFNVFSPEAIRIDAAATAAPLRLTSLTIGNRPAGPRDGGRGIDVAINYLQRLTLTHDETFLNFGFAQLNYQSPSATDYAYRMEGFDPEWNLIGNRTHANYTDLPPGSYTFRVRATNGGQSVESRLPVTIVPPFYRRPLAYFLYLLALIGLGLYAYRVNAARQARRNEEKVEAIRRREEKAFYTRKVEFFTDMAHEIRTPLSLITAPLEELLEAGNADPETRSQLALMHTNADRLRVLTNQLLDFRRVESNAYRITKRPVDLIPFAKNIYAAFSALSRQRDLRFRLITSDRHLMVEADSEALTKIVSNLITNALKYAREEVTLEISRETIGDIPSFRFVVFDDGIGIPPQHLKDVFDRFFTVNDGEHQYGNLGGTGVGLSLARRLTELHDGSLEVDSRQGVYTRFTATFPVGQVGAEAPEQPTPEAVTDGRASGQTAVLVVEDNPDLLQFLAASFRRHGYYVYTAQNADEALGQLAQHDIDLIVSDIMMAGMDGVELCETVKSAPETGHLPVILLSARANVESRISGLEAGADAYIIKPFKVRHLLATVKNLLTVRQTLRARYLEEPFVSAKTLTHNQQDKEFVTRIIDMVEENLPDGDLTVEQLSQIMGMSRSGLHKKLKIITGQSPNEFMRVIRLKKAAALLKAGRYNVSEVAYQVGFNSPSYFTKCFTEQFSQTPSSFLGRTADT